MKNKILVRLCITRFIKIRHYSSDESNFEFLIPKGYLWNEEFYSYPFNICTNKKVILFLLFYFKRNNKININHKSEGYNIAIVGAGGLVGRKFIEILEERNFPVNDLRLFATEHSKGQIIRFRNSDYEISNILDYIDDGFRGCDIALFSAGKEASMRYAQLAAEMGCIVIDNGSYWRMHPMVPLIVPEVNPHDIHKHTGIIANPNCSTIQLVIALKPVSESFGLKRVVVSTYQSVSGGGQIALDQIIAELNYEEPKNRISKHPLAFNTVFHPVEDESGNSIEEIKMVNETRKILNLPDLKINTTCVRLPFFAGHAESVNIETESSFTIDEVRDTLANQPGLIIIDNPGKEDYPTILQTAGTDLVYCGRIRRDESLDNGLNLWITSDNVRKGAATNAIQIAELLIQ
jgi:aspartate-semialdehyde dehydrogenase